jgi:hypothetical protein
MVQRTRIRATWLGVLFVALIAVTLFWDVIPARMEFRRLCDAESGIRVYKRIPLDAEFRGMEISGLFSVYQESPMGKRYPHRLVETNDLPGPGRIRRIVNTISDARSGETLGSLTTFYYGGGWLANVVPSGARAGGGSCGVEVAGARALASAIFEDNEVRR